jgi:hypothetical protein
VLDEREPAAGVLPVPDEPVADSFLGTADLPVPGADDAWAFVFSFVHRSSFSWIAGAQMA